MGKLRRLNIEEATGSCYTGSIKSVEIVLNIIRPTEMKYGLA